MRSSAHRVVPICALPSTARFRASGRRRRHYISYSTTSPGRASSPARPGFTGTRSFSGRGTAATVRSSACGRGGSSARGFVPTVLRRPRSSRLEVEDSRGDERVILARRTILRLGTSSQSTRRRVCGAIAWWMSDPTATHCSSRSSFATAPGIAMVTRWHSTNTRWMPKSTPRRTHCVRYAPTRVCSRFPSVSGQRRTSTA